MNSYMGAVVDWSVLWEWVTVLTVITVTIMSVMVVTIDDLVSKRSWRRIDPRAVQVPFRNRQ